MTHVRQSLRSAVVAACTGLAATGSRVYTARVYAQPVSDLPALWINTPSEDAVIDDLGLPGTVRRDVTVEVRGLAAGSSMAATLDTIAEQVETAIGSSVTVGGVVVPMRYAGCIVDYSFGDDAEQPVGSITLTFTATLFTAANAPGTLTQ